VKIVELGDGDPEFAVVGGIHGDEPCGKMAVEKFLDEDFEIQKPVKLVIANEKALSKGERFIETDLNRIFPGDPESEYYEERLAAEMVDELKGLKILDLHSTKSSSEVFAALSKLSEEKFELAKKAGATKISYNPNEKICSIDEYLQAVTVECGFQGTEMARKQAYEVLINFLAANQIIDQEYKVTEPEVYEVFDTVEKPEYRFTAENFQKVNKGEVFAKKEDQELKADQSFYPVLMSTNGYDNILGRRAKRVED
jgi:succinylglutamate desuccinylase